MHSTVSDAVLMTLLSSVDPSVPAGTWDEHAAAVYAVTGLLVSPEKLKSFYFASIAEHGSRTAAYSAVAERVRLAAASLKDPRPDSAPGPRAAPNGAAVASRGNPYPVAALAAGAAVVDSLYGADVFRPTLSGGVFMTYNGAELGPYASVIKHPASLTSLNEAIGAGTIKTDLAAELHLRRMTANCVMFNAPEGEFPVIARTFGAAATREMAQALMTWDRPSTS